MLGQLRTCFNLMKTGQNSFLSPPKELRISMTYLLRSLSAMLKFLSNSVKNLGFVLDCHLTMNAHVSNIGCTCYFELHRLASIIPVLLLLIPGKCSNCHTCICFCFVKNSLQFGSTLGVTSHLQQIQNYAA